jgi:hypothetical protein
MHLGVDGEAEKFIGDAGQAAIFARGVAAALVAGCMDPFSSKSKKRGWTPYTSE